MTRLQEQHDIRVASSVKQLQVLRDLFQRLHRDEVPYCHWKSNEHLDASMRGATDLDLLVHRSAALPLARILAELGFKRFAVKAGAGYPGVEDYLGFDRETGALSHLHIHYQLTLGAKFVKGHRLPWEDAVLDARCLNETHAIYTANFAHELVLLVVRAALKLRLRDIARSVARRSIFRGDTLRELRWLAERVDAEELRRGATPLIGERAAMMLERMRTHPTSLSELRAFGRAVTPALKTYRLYSPLRAASRAFVRELGTVWTVIARRYRASGIPVNWSTRTPPQGGVVVEIIGISGAGKTVATGLLSDWLSREVAVFPVNCDQLAGGSRRAARRARDLGMVVLCDGSLGTGAPPSRTSADAGSLPADLVLRLELSPDAAATRTGAAVERLRQQDAMLDDRTYAGRTRVVTVDARQPLPEMLLRLKHAIWEEL